MGPVLAVSGRDFDLLIASYLGLRLTRFVVVPPQDRLNCETPDTYVDKYVRDVVGKDEIAETGSIGEGGVEVLKGMWSCG